METPQWRFLFQFLLSMEIKGKERGENLKAHRQLHNDTQFTTEKSIHAKEPVHFSDPEYKYFIPFSSFNEIVYEP